jgi:hypothetical protein
MSSFLNPPSNLPFANSLFPLKQNPPKQKNGRSNHPLQTECIANAENQNGKKEKEKSRS